MNKLLASIVDAHGGLDRWKAHADGDDPLETLAAELTLGPFRVALRARTEGTWLDLELDLWRALAETAKTWREGIAPAPPDGDAACTLQRR